MWRLAWYLPTLALIMGAPAPLLVVCAAWLIGLGLWCGRHRESSVDALLVADAAMWWWPPKWHRIVTEALNW